MLSSNGFLRIVHEAFAPFLRDLGFEVSKEHVSGRFCSTTFASDTRQIDVSYEPGDEYYGVKVCPRGCEFRVYDDPVQSPMLEALNVRFMVAVTDEERRANEAWFSHIEAHSDDERKLLKLAMELRLVLPKYLATL